VQALPGLQLLQKPQLAEELRFQQAGLPQPPVQEQPLRPLLRQPLPGQGYRQLHRPLKVVGKEYLDRHLVLLFLQAKPLAGPELLVGFFLPFGLDLLLLTLLYTFLL
jgi:hypothetical protein